MLFKAALLLPTVAAFSPISVPSVDVPTSLATESVSVVQQQTSKNGINLSHKTTGSSPMLLQGIQEWLVPPANAATAPKPPTDSEIKLLRSAFEALYGVRDAEKAETLLTQAITAWERQPPDERAALYRVRGDCYTALLNADLAVQDYTTTIDLLTGEGGELADPAELPAARLGRARALRGMGKLSQEQNAIAANDYKESFLLSSRDDWDTDQETIEDGASRNPYAAWEWGMVRRGAGDYNGAAESHTLASLAFKDIGDRARSVISALDAGIDLAATDKSAEAQKTLEDSIKRTTSVEGTDIELLQRVIAKEGEARIALASVLWGSGDKPGAEKQLGEASARLDQLQADADAREALRIKKGLPPPVKAKKLKFTIDDTVGPEATASRYKSEKFVSDTLLWPEPLQQKLAKLNKLEK